VPSTTMRKLSALAAACLCALAAFAPSAAHAGVGQILRDCNVHGKLTGHYSQKELAEALAQLQGDQSEYTDCESSIRAAQAAAARQGAQSHEHNGNGNSARAHAAGNGGSSNGGSGGSSSGGSQASSSHPATKADENAIRQASSSPSDVPLPGGGTISPTKASAAGSSGLHAMPVPLRVVLILLATGALAGIGLGVRRRVLDRRTDT
jgi:cobalamin biosynthesis Mg chelatase CobN